MNTNELRYEWRIWVDDATDIAARVAALGTHRESRVSAETYLVSRATTEANPKVRDDLLDVKLLRRVSDGFEQWEPQQKRSFPVASAIVATEVLLPLGVPAPELRRPEYPLAQLIDEVVANTDVLAAVDVTKRREMFTIGLCTAEVSAVDVAGTTLHTAAIESTNLAALQRIRDEIGLGSSGNTSYPKALHRVLGWGLAEEE